MTFTSEMQSFLAPLEALQKLIEKFDNRGVVIGGIASSLLGKTRLTADLDVMILLSINDIPDLIREAGNAGLEMRIDNADEFARKNRVLLLRHRDSATNIDITLGNLPFEEEVVERSQLINIGKISIRLPTVEDLIIMKAVAHRAKDILDIQGVVDANPDLDKQRIEYWLRQFAEALESPEIWLDVEKLLQD
jgi:predicted nucleotidyltransferase